MIRRLYINNFRCLVNFELPLSGKSSVILIGNNGSGKSTIGAALELFQKIGRGTNRVDLLVKPKDFTQGRTEMPMRFEIEVELGGRTFAYSVAFEFPTGFRELRVLDETLKVDRKTVYSRDSAQVNLSNGSLDREARFHIDWHLVALPIVQEQSASDPLSIFKRWLGRMLILRPVPSLINGDSNGETLEPNSQVTNFGEWFTGLLAESPSAYSEIDKYLKQVMPDFQDIQNPVVGKDARSIRVQFSNENETVKLPFEDLSDGEKCFMICALVLAANKSSNDLLCFWDEPDNFLSLPEVGQFVMLLRTIFQSAGQLIATSHNLEAIRSFSDDTTLVLGRKNHLEPSVVRLREEIDYLGDLETALVEGELNF